METIKNLLRNLLKGAGIKNVLIVSLVLAVVFLGWLSWRSPKPVNVQELLSNLEQRLAEKHQIEIKDREAKIRDLTNRLVVSDAKHQSLLKKLTEVKNETIVPPKSNAELRARFIALGFAPK